MQVDEDNSQLLLHGWGVNILRLLMVDDHLMLSEALGLRLSTTTDLWIVGRCATDDDRLPGLATQLRPDLITVDVEPLGAAAGDFVRGLRAARSSMDVVVLTGDQEVQHAIDVARAGAAAWVRKESNVDELREVIRGVRRGQAWFPPEMLGAVLHELREDARRAAERSGPLDVLSDRERDVLSGMVEGKRGAQIGEELMISNETVRTHVRSILAKLHVHSQLEAVSVASAAGFRATVPGRGLPAPRRPRSGDRR